jgi:pyruvate dehydrogenase E1 component alpha subunit
MAELFGRETGYNRGKGGSMHLANMELGILGANGIVGAGTALATGAALSAKLRATEQVSVCLFGDGAANEGTFHESLNLAAVWSLPVIFLCENNRWGELTRMEKVTALGAIVQRADAYGIPGVTVDGNDVFPVHSAMTAAVDRARSGGGPTLIEAMTFRMREHSEGLDMVFGKAATPEEAAQWQARDPIARLRIELESAGVDPAELAAMEEAAAEEMAAALAFAKASPPPAPTTAFEDMWAATEVSA